MERKSRRVRTPRTTLLENKIPPQLFALGLMLGEEGLLPGYVSDSLERALDRADRILADAVMAQEPLVDNRPVSLVFDSLKTRVYVKEPKTTDVEGVALEAIEAGLWLGLAISFRFFAGGAK